ncbi:hypothetical protein M1B52_004770 [Salmonella enterica]|nr:hypothetical protein [Salmonella enterica]
MNNDEKFYYFKASMKMVSESIFELFLGLRDSEYYMDQEEYFDIVSYFKTMCNLRGDYWFYEKSNLLMNNENHILEITEDEYNYPDFPCVDIGVLIDISDICFEEISHELKKLQIEDLLKMDINYDDYPSLKSSYPEIYSMKEKRKITESLCNPSEIKRPVRRL